MAGSSSIKPIKWQSFVSLMLLGALLLLGFCPLRNTLIKLVRAKPVSAGHPILEYGKITSGSECLTFTKVKVLPLTEKRFRAPNTELPAAVIGAGLVFCFTKPGAILSGNTFAFRRVDTIPIYLKNCVLRI